MEPFVKLDGVVAPLDRVNVDTDQIIPAVYLKSIQRTGFEDALFAAWRYNEDGSPNPEFVLNVPEYRKESGCAALVGGRRLQGAECSNRASSRTPQEARPGSRGSRCRQAFAVGHAIESSQGASGAEGLQDETVGALLEGRGDELVLTER